MSRLSDLYPQGTDLLLSYPEPQEIFYSLTAGVRRGVGQAAPYILLERGVALITLI